METIWIVRHGQSTLNSKNQFSGTTNCRLTNEGRQTAKKIGDFFKEKDILFEAVYSSPLKRATQSTEIISRQLGLDKKAVIKENRLREQDFSEWERKTREKIEKKNPGIIAKWISDPYNIKPKKGENYYDVEHRLLPFIKKIINSKEKTILLVTHANAIKALAKLFLFPKRVNNIELNTRHNTIYKFSVKEKKIERFFC